MCRWGSKECAEVQKILHEKEPKGPYTGWVKVPNKLKATTPGGELNKPDKKKLHRRHRLQIHCGISADQISNSNLYVAKHHWRPSVHDFFNEQKGKIKSLCSYCKFEDRSAWRAVVGLDDEADVYDDGKEKLVMLAPNFPKKEWSHYTRKYGDALSTERDNRLAALQESKKRNCSVAELETELHIANQKIRKRDNDNAELKRELKKRKIESKELTTTQRREKEDMKKEISKLQDQCRRLTKKKDELRDTEKQLMQAMQAQVSFVFRIS